LKFQFSLIFKDFRSELGREFMMKVIVSEGDLGRMKMEIDRDLIGYGGKV
jgi:hypothetical protein